MSHKVTQTENYTTLLVIYIFLGLPIFSAWFRMEPIINSSLSSLEVREDNKTKQNHIVFNGCVPQLVLGNQGWSLMMKGREGGRQARKQNRLEFLGILFFEGPETTSFTTFHIFKPRDMLHANCRTGHVPAHSSQTTSVDYGATEIHYWEDILTGPQLKFPSHTKTQVKAPTQSLMCQSQFHKCSMETGQPFHGPQKTTQPLSDPLTDRSPKAY